MAAIDTLRDATDAAVNAYHADPTEANRLAVLAAMRAHNEAFLREQTVEFIARTT